MMDKQTEEAVLNVSLAQTEEMFRERVLEVLVQELTTATVRSGYGSQETSPLQIALIDFLTQRVSMQVSVPSNNSVVLPVQVYLR